MKLLFMAVAWLSGEVVAQPVLVDRIAVLVDGQPLFRSAIEARARRSSGGKKTEAERRQAFAQARTELIETYLIEGDAKGLTVSDQLVEAALDDISKSNQLDRAQLEAAAKQQGYTLAEYRESVRSQLLELRWLMARAEERGLKPTSPDERTRAMASLRTALLEQLSKRAVIEVLE